MVRRARGLAVSPPPGSAVGAGRRGHRPGHGTAGGSGLGSPPPRPPFLRVGAAASGCDAQSVARRRSDSRLAGEASPGESDASALSSMGMASVDGGAQMMRSSSSTAMWCVSRSESLASTVSTRDLSSAIAAFFDNGGGGAAPSPADATLEPGFGGGGGCAVVGDLGWDLTADLESAVAIAVGICSMRVGRGGGVGMARSDLNWWVRGLGDNLGHLVANLRWIWWDLLGAEMRLVGGEESAKTGFEILCWLMRRGGRADGSGGERERENYEASFGSSGQLSPGNSSPKGDFCGRSHPSPRQGR